MGKFFDELTGDNNEIKNIEISNHLKNNEIIDELSIRLIVEQSKILLEKYNGRCMLTPTDIIEILGIKKDSAYNLFNNYDFPTTLIGKKKYISIINLCKWMSKQNP